MSTLPEEIKLTYLIAILLLFLFLLFILAFILIYKNKQTALYNENLVKEALLKNQQLESELEKQLALQSERDRISSDMHDELGSGLSSIKLISEMLKKKHSDTETKSDLNDIVDYATTLTDTMREMVWSLNPRNDVLPRFVDHTVYYAKQFFEPTEINFKIIADQDLPEITMNGFVRRNLFLCLKEIFNNIIKHAQAKNVSCTISFFDKKLSIQIQDDGVGIHEIHKEGNGLYSIKKRITDCNGSIVWTNQNPGLDIAIVIPLNAGNGLLIL